MTSTDFTNKVTVITGASEGLGFDFARKMVDAGGVVHFCSENRARGEAAARELGARAAFHLVDLAQPDAITNFAEAVAASSPHVDYLINNAAIDDHIALGDVTPDIADQMWAVNLRPFLLVSRAFLPLLKRGSGKAIVNLGTTNYMLGLEPFTLYNATKSGIVGVTRSMARELGHEGIRVNMVSPGWIMTDKQLSSRVSEQDKQDLLRDQSLKFLLSPKHVTPAVLFLLSEAAAGITGQNLVVDGGKVMY